jgi:hypothetical protein
MTRHHEWIYQDGLMDITTGRLAHWLLNRLPTTADMQTPFLISLWKAHWFGAQLQLS